MRVQRAYKTELDLNERQVTACRQHAGAARWAYNWGLQRKQERYKATKKSPTAINLEKLAESSSDSQNACGVAGAGARSGPRVKPATKKQEPNARSGLSISG